MEDKSSADKEGDQSALIELEMKEKDLGRLLMSGMSGY